MSPGVKVYIQIHSNLYTDVCRREETRWRVYIAAVVEKEVGVLERLNESCASFREYAAKL